MQKLVEKTQNSQVIEKATQNYQKAVEKIKQATEKIKETAETNNQVGKFLDKFVQQQILHQRILQKLETQVSTTTFAKIEEARQEHLEKFGEVMTKLEQKNEEKIQDRLEKNLGKLSTSTQETINKIKDQVIEKIQQRINEATTTEVQPRTHVLCAQVITYRQNPQTGECQEFPTPCSAPTGWEECVGATPLPNSQ